MLEISNNSIIGVGTDICDVPRIESLLNKYKDSFLEKTFLDFEIEYCSSKANPAQHFAARFAAKEAMAKALGTGFRDNISLKSFAVKNDVLGKPIAVLDENVLAYMKSINAKKMSVSLSHLNNFAVAFAILSI